MEKLKVFIEPIKQASELRELKQLHEEVAFLLSTSSWTMEETLHVYEILSSCHELFVKKALCLAEWSTDEKQIGKKPTKWSWFVMGSMGRKEPTVWTDQDNGILFSCCEEEKEDGYAYMREYARIGTDYLHGVGYPYCSGNVMATNVRWMKEITDWHQQIDCYLDNQQPDDIRYLLIAADLRPIYGENMVIQEAREQLYMKIANNETVRIRMGENMLIPPVPLGPFGRMYVERWGTNSGKFDVKQSGYVQISNMIKFLAIKQQVFADSTLERIKVLNEIGFFPFEFAEEVRQAFIVFLFFRFRSSVRSPNDHISLTDLSKAERQQLKMAMKVAKKLQRNVAKWVQ
ncbi:DUF294 nucleotidyltransferase-like domain-containing protein [Thermolongibacillus altinsuensis]